MLTKVNAGVLQLTLGIGVIISILCGSMILLVYYSKIEYLQQHIADRLRVNVNSGIQFGMASRNSLPFNSPQTLDLFSQERDSVIIVRKPWGAYEILAVKAWQGTHIQAKAAMISALPDEKGSSVIYTPENNAPIYLVGDTKIDGVAFLPERKFTAGYINGQDFNEKKFIDGTTITSTRDILPLDSTLIDWVNSVYTGTQTRWLRSEQFPLHSPYSFLDDQPYYYHSTQSIDLTDSLAGNVIIQSDIKVRVTAGAYLENIILIAPHIDIDNNFQGSVQCFATNYIQVGTDCKLNYPSSLVLMGKEQDSLISVKRNSVIEGLVMIPGYDKAISSKGIFTLEKGAILHGSVYINGQSNIQGSIWGHIMTRSFTALDGSTPYASHLLNAELSSAKRSPDMPGSLLWGNTNKIVVAKWLE